MISHTCRELEVAVYGVDGRGEGGITDPLLADIHTEFNQCLNSFQKNTKVRLILLHVLYKN